ncbi:MAG: Flp pilus assembly protein CpaB [Halobacteriovoraceae bacterium]|nr:Flp pilus assembly protein CpaB [Halobacteriovoraceae bacterium]
MNTRAFTLALVIALIAMSMVYSYIQGVESKYIAQYENKTTVVVASVDIPELTLLDHTKLTLKEVPKAFEAPKAYKTIEDLQNTIALAPILKNEQITAPRVTYPGAKTGLSRQISVGKRAMAIRVSEDQAVGKLIKPGDRVDVIIGVDYAGGRLDRNKAKTLFQNVYVLSVGKLITNTIPMAGRIGDNSEVKKMNLTTYTDFNTVTLELTPIEAQRLSFVLSHLRGRPYLALRNNNDNSSISLKSTNLFDVLLGDDIEDSTEAKVYFQERYDQQKRGGR